MKAALSLITARQNASGVLTGFDALPSSLLKTNPGFVVSSAERLILSKRPTGRGSKSLDRLGTMSLSNGPKGGRFTICS